MKRSTHIWLDAILLSKLEMVETGFVENGSKERKAKSKKKVFRVDDDKSIKLFSPLWFSRLAISIPCNKY